MKSQLKLGIIVSYLNIALNMCISVFFTPFLISSLGDAEYGVYRIVHSFVGQLSIMTFGMSTLVTRNIVYYDTKQQKEEKENFLAMAFIISVIMALVVLASGFFMYRYTGVIFKNSLNSDEIKIAKQLVGMTVLNIVFTVINDCFAGMLTGHEKFATANLIKTLRLILRIVTLVLLLNLGFKSIAIVATDLMLTVLVLLFNILYGMIKLRERIKFYYFDKVMFKTSILFSSAILLQAIINQVNQNLDSFILGVMTDSKTVAIYSIALVVYTTCNGLPTAIISVFTPTVTRMIAKNATSDELTAFVSKCGRYQLMVMGAIIAGFILFGKEFICVWIDEGFLPAYKISLILIIPVTIPLIQNGCNLILDAKLKRMSRSVILGVMAVINLVLSVILVKKIGYIGAAYGTAISTVVGHIIIMNIYLSKCIGLNIINMFRDIFHRILPCIIVSGIVSVPLKWLNLADIALISLIIKLILFVMIYCIITYIFGMNTSEKDLVKGILNKLKRSKNNVH